MKLTILGSGPAIPNPGGASSGYLIESGESRLLVESGHGVASVLQTRLQLSDLTAVIISHMHPDHMFDLVPLSYGFRFGNLPKIPLLLPPTGTDSLRRLQNAIGVPDDFFDVTFDVCEYESESGRIFLPDITVELAPTQHYIAAYAMRFVPRSSGEADIVYSSDTAWIDDVVDLGRGASLALLESTLLEYPDTNEIHGHMTATEAGAMARAMGVRRLVLTHYWSAWGARLQAAAATSFGNPVELAVGGDTYAT